MTDDKTFERIARTWLEEGPARAPERAIDAALTTIETTPQQRVIRFPRRSSRMFTPQRLAAAAAIVAVVLGGGFLLFGRTPPLIGTPSPSPSSTLAPSALPTASGVADLLRATWLSVSAIGDSGAQQLNIDETRLGIGESTTSWILTDADTRLRVQYAEDWSPSDADRWNCKKDDQGSYLVNLSPDGQTLALDLVSDTCADRARMLATTDWTRTGPLSTGHHVAALFKPLSSGGSLSYTVPAGWTEISESPTSFLMYAPGGRTTVQLMSNAKPYVLDATCNVAAASTTTPAAAGHWLATLNALITTQPVDTQIGGLNGVSVDAAVAPGGLDPCSSQPSIVETFSSSGGNSDELDYGEKARYMVLDAGDGQILLIIIGTDAPNFGAALATATPVIDSFEFSTSPSGTANAHQVASPVALGKLRDVWQSVGRRTFPHEGLIPVTFTIDDAGLRIAPGEYEVRNSMSSAPDGSLVVTLQPADVIPSNLQWPCTSGDDGRYAVHLSPDEQTLTLENLADNCAARASVLAGDWTRRPCGDRLEQYCITEASPGKQASIFKPFDGGSSGSFAYTLPSGWTANAASPSLPGPASASAMSLSLVGAYDGPGVDVFANVVARSDATLSQQDPCGPRSPETQSATAIADWLESLNDVNVNDRTPITLGGLTGVQLDVTLVPAAGHACAAAGTVYLFVSLGYEGDIGLSSLSNEYARYIVLDRDGGVLLIAVTASGQSAWQTFISQATPVVDSFVFSTSGS